jgi:hypothetical protein
MMNTTKTWTTKYGYMATITLAEAMIIAERNRRAEMCTNLGEALRLVGYWRAIEAQARKHARPARRRVRDA